MMKVQEANRNRALEYKRRRDKAKERIEEAQRTSEEILVMKRLKFVRIFVCFAFLTPHFFNTLLGLMEVEGGGFSIKRLEGASEVPVFFWGVMTAVFLVMNTLNSFWAFGMVKIALGVGGGKKKKDEKKKKKKEESVTTRKLTFVNWFGYGPVLAFFPSDEKRD
jgi:hypothetical protein